MLLLLLLLLVTISKITIIMDPSILSPYPIPIHCHTIARGAVVWQCLFTSFLYRSPANSLIRWSTSASISVSLWYLWNPLIFVQISSISTYKWKQKLFELQSIYENITVLVFLFSHFLFISTSNVHEGLMNTSPYGETLFCCQATLKFLLPLTVNFKKGFTDPELEFHPPGWEHISVPD